VVDEAVLAARLATHWLADAGSAVPQSYRDVFLSLGEQNVIPCDLAQRLAAASGLRNLVAHQYAVIDWARIHEIAALHLDDLCFSARRSRARRVAEAEPS